MVSPLEVVGEDTRVLKVGSSRVSDFDRPPHSSAEAAPISDILAARSNCYPEPPPILQNRFHSSTRFLVVDDHFVVRGGVIGLLQAQEGYVVVAEAETAEESIAKAVLFKPDIVILDVGLPIVGGIGVASELRQICPATKTIVFSVSTDSVHVHGMLAAGAKAYVLKTSEPSTLLSAIRVVLSGSRFLDPGLSDMVVEELDIFPEVKRRNHDVLTPREAQVLERIVWGYTNKQIATELDIKRNSVNTYRNRLCEKLDLTGRAEVVRYGIALGLAKTWAPQKPPKSTVAPETAVPFDCEGQR